MKKSLILLFVAVACMFVAGCVSLPENGDAWKADIYGMVSANK